ncbi:MAG: class I SAM-dependent methyltransferase [Chloroflexi bacterium]|nr:class I SAM-dependent methyltransferase [Chloroflexota bacterium]
MDAEYLARRGGAVVADVEHLPYADRSLDMVYVHDGLHHLSDPMVSPRTSL